MPMPKIPKIRCISFENGRKKSKLIKVSTFEDGPASSASLPGPDIDIIGQQQEELKESEPNTQHENENVSYHDKKKKFVESWERIRYQLLDTRIEEFSPMTLVCDYCGRQEENIIKCDDCGPTTHFCKSCVITQHQQVVFHSPRIWNGKVFLPFPLDKTVLRRKDHECNNGQYLTDIVAVDLMGRKSVVGVQFCSCEMEAVTLIRYSLWPATPTSPKLAFDFKLMELCTVLQLECQMPTKSFVEALKFFKTYQINSELSIDRDIYRSLVGDCMMEYMYNRSSLNTRHTVTHETFLKECLVCQQNPSCIALDANFGLVRKASSGNSYDQEPRHKGPFFRCQKRFLDFVEDYAVVPKEYNCSNFKAGNALRSNQTNSKLDITGLFGSVCKHDVPLQFLNMNRGESLAYSSFLVMEFSNMSSEKVVISYDIACSLEKHLKKNNKDLLERIILTVPVFHSFAHNLSCQLNFGQRFVKETGLVDGEGIERFWSFLRQFKKITKEMRSVNRQDLLTEAMFHYSEKAALKLGIKLDNKLEEAKKSVNQCKQKLDIDLQPLGQDYEDVKQWIEHLKNQVNRSHQKGNQSGTRDMLLRKLRQLSIERQQLTIMLKRYADGQHIWKRISKQLSNNTTLINKKIKQLAPFVKIGFKDVVDINSNLFDTDPYCEITKEQRCMIDVYMLLERSNQELESTEFEKQKLIDNISSQCVKLNEEIDRIKYTDNSRFNNGVSNFLHYHIFVLENLFKEWNLKPINDSDVESDEDPGEDEEDGDPTGADESTDEDS